MTPDVEPGYLRELLPKEAPQRGEKWEDIFRDFETKILPGVTHWQHPRFHAYFPAGNCYPSIIGEMLSAGLGIVGFSWAASPSCTELETIVLDWLGRMINLPKNLLPFGDDETAASLKINAVISQAAAAAASTSSSSTSTAGPSDANNNNIANRHGSSSSNEMANHHTTGSSGSSCCNHHPHSPPFDGDDDVPRSPAPIPLTGGGVILV